MDVDKLVSFVVTTKNEEAYLASCLKSIRNQTYGNVEIIVVDSCSEDGTVEIAKKYADKVLVRDCIMPVGRNFGARLARGGFLVFLDADIVLTEDWLEKAFQKLDGETVAVCGDLFPEATKGLKNKLLYWFITFTKAVVYGLGIPNVGHGGTAVLVSKEAFEKVGGYTNKFACGEDFDFSLRLAELGKVKFERKVQGYFSLRSFKKFGYLNRLAYWGKNFYRYLIRHNPPVHYVR